MILTKPGLTRPLVIPKYAAVLVFVIKTAYERRGCPASATSNY